MQFRKDINGLRAIAVIAVVLFHFNVSWLPGGFTGVDVFFVISGFLMTGIIFRGIEQENFSILRFYVSRANRIIPALSVLCLVLLVLGWFYLTPLDYKELSKHVVGSMGFISNVIFSRESGYFDVASNEKWLLHTWSLSAEWQFYIIYPLVLVAMRKFMPVAAMKITILIGTLLGFIFCVIATYKWPNPAYYLLPTRAWEMMIGGVAYLYPIVLKESRKKILEWLGLSLIIASYAFLSESELWPSYLSLLPVLGSFLVIQARRADSFITSNVIFQTLGSWSYSIYLWHWPLAVAIYYFSLGDFFTYVFIALSVLLGFLSNRYIERFRFERYCFNLFFGLKFAPVYMVFVVGLIGAVVFLSNGFEARGSNKQYSLADAVERLKPNHGLSNKCEGKFTLSSDCKTSETPEILVWGDSFSMHLVSGILASKPEAKLIQLTKSSCGPFFNISKMGAGSFADECFEFTKSVKEWLQSNTYLKYAVISSPFNYENQPEIMLRNGDVRALSKIEVVEHFRNTLNELERLGIVPVIFTPPPQSGGNIGKCLDKASFFGEPLSSCDFSIDLITKEQTDIYGWLLEFSSQYKLINLNDYLCSSGVCKTHIDKVYIYRDKGHLSYEGSARLGMDMDFYNLITERSEI